MSGATSDRNFQPIRPNPYIVGNPVRNPAMFFGREFEFELVGRRFKDAREGSLLVFCGERRSGKTSILMQIQQGRLGPEFIPVLIDMQAMVVENEAQFLSQIAQEIVEQLGEEGRAVEAPDFGRGKPSATFRGFIEAILARHPHRKLLLLFDEYELFEDKLDSGVLTQDVLLILSTLMENLPTFVVFTGSHHLEERRKEYWRILEKTHEYRRISYLQPADAVRLIQEPVAGRVTYSDDTVQRIMRLTAGHPFYTQAVCQNLVDALNDNRTNMVTEQTLASVVEMIVENPFPQMTFLWDTLEREQKLTLALLAEVLQGAEMYATTKQLASAIRKGNYPLHLSRPAISTALETLFKDELLSKKDGRVPGYAFRMDLWRQWIRRMHAVWQVMREEHIEIRPPRVSTVRVVAAVALVVGVLGPAVWLWQSFGRRAVSTLPGKSEATGGALTGFVRILTKPADASIRLAGQPFALLGQYESRLTTAQAHRFELQASGYMDSTLVVHLAEGDSSTYNVSLRPSRGGLRIETDPDSAGIWLNGEYMGRGKAERLGLPVPEEHTVEARLENYRPISHSVRVLPESTLVVPIRLDPVTIDLQVDSDPQGAALWVGGVRRGDTPFVLSGLGFGQHDLRATMAGYLPKDTTLVVNPSTKQRLLLRLTPQPGTLRVRCADNRPARIHINGQQVGSGDLCSEMRQVDPGEYSIEVIFRDGSIDKITVDVAPGRTVEVLWEAQKLRVLRDER